MSKTLTLYRFYRPADGLYSVGRLFDADGRFLCDTIEDTDRGLTSGMPLAEIKKKKIPAKTAIPRGRYRLTLDVVSPKFSQKAYYQHFCQGRVPRLLNVPGFEGILIHCGTSEKSSAGCIIVGYNTLPGRVTRSREAFERLYSLLREYHDHHHAIYLHIK